MARRKARELAFRTLFQAERGDSPLLEVWEQLQVDLVTDSTEDEAADTQDAYGDQLDSEGISFAGSLLAAFADHKADIDARLEATLEGWTFGQMAQTDLNVLRLALTEFLFVPNIPREVTIEMAVRIAKKFGGEESGRFVNGVLARLYQELPANAS